MGAAVKCAGYKWFFTQQMVLIQEAWGTELDKNEKYYSQVPNKRVGPNKKVGWLF